MWYQNLNNEINRSLLLKKELNIDKHEAISKVFYFNKIYHILFYKFNNFVKKYIKKINDLHKQYIE